MIRKTIQMQLELDISAPSDFMALSAAAEMEEKLHAALQAWKDEQVGEASVNAIELRWDH